MCWGFRSWGALGVLGFSRGFQALGVGNIRLISSGWDSGFQGVLGLDNLKLHRV